MKFWDTSAIVPLLAQVPESPACHRLWRSDPRVVVWALTETEALSALCRRLREGVLGSQEAGQAEARIEKLASRWVEIESLPPVKEEAARLLHLHRLRAADALQLGAALVAFNRRPKKRAFVSLDEELLEAARREGFDALQPA